MHISNNFVIIKVGNIINKGGSTLLENTKLKLVVEKEFCKGCGICVAFCPKDVLILEKGKVKVENLDACIQCGQCELRCPDYAIYLGGN